MTVWAKNDDVPEKQDKYGIVVLERLIAIRNSLTILNFLVIHISSLT